MGPILDEVAADLAGKIKVAKVNIEEGSNQELAAQYEVQSIPNMKLFIGGKMIFEFIGLHSKEDLEKDISGFIEKNKK